MIFHTRPDIKSRQVVGRAGNLHDGAILVRCIEAVTYRTDLSEGPGGSEYKLEVLLYPHFGL